MTDDSQSPDVGAHRVLKRGDLADPAAEPGAELLSSFGKVWRPGPTMLQLSYGSYRACSHQSDGSVPPASLFIADQQSPFLQSVHEYGRRLANSQTLRLCSFFSEGEFEGTPAFLCQGLSTGTLQQLLQLVTRLNIHNDLTLLKQIALAVDEARICGVPGVEMEDHEVFLGLDPSLGLAPPTEEEWPGYFTNQGRAEGGHTAGVAAIVLPRLIESAPPQETRATSGGEYLASNPLARFAGFLYRVLSGIPTKQTAYLSTVNYVSFPELSEEANQHLSQVMAGMETPASASSLLHQICQIEDRPFPRASATEQGSGPAVLTSAIMSAPPPKNTRPPGEAPKKKRKKRSPALVLIPLVLLLGGGGAGAWFFYFKNKPVEPIKPIAHIEPPVEVANVVPMEQDSGKVTFPRTAASKGGEDVSIGLQDAEGALLGRLTIDGNIATVNDFPAAAFDSSEHWPLKFVSLDPNYMVLGDVFDRDDFSTTGSKTWQCDALLDLEIRATALINPALTFQGAPVDNAAGLLSSLSSHDHSKDWNVTMEGGAVRIDLDEGERFPVEAELSISFMKPVQCTLKGPGEFSAILQLENRSLLIGGVSDAHDFVFEPDMNEVKNEAVRALLRGKIPKTEIDGATLRQGRGKWTIPSLAGTISVSFNGQVNRGVIVNSETRCLVLVNELTHLPQEDDKMLRLRQLAERGGVASQYMLGALYDKTSTDKLHGRV
jgi:hypothetical protein